MATRACARAVPVNEEALAESGFERLGVRLPFFREQLGIVFALLAITGAVRILRSSTASPFYVVVATSVGVSFVFLLIDLYSPLQIRYLLQLLPLLAIFAGKCLSDIMGRGRLGKFAGLLTLGYVMVAGADNMLFCLLERYY